MDSYVVGASLKMHVEEGEGRAPCCVVLGTKGGAAQAWLQCGWHQAIFCIEILDFHKIFYE